MSKQKKWDSPQRRVDRCMSNNFRFDAVFWDMDGTLVDSEPNHLRSFVDAMGALGLTIPDDFHDRTLGMTEKDVHEYLRSDLGLELDLVEWAQARFDAYAAKPEMVKPHDIAFPIWEKLDEMGVQQMVVSNSDRLIVEYNLERVGLLRPQLKTISRNDVIKGKPDAEPYLRAAYLCGVEPSKCAVVEDSGTGLAAGIAAGMTVFMMPEFASETPHPYQPIASLLG